MLFAQILLPRLVGMVGVFFLGECLQCVHGSPHLLGLHPRGQCVLIQTLRLVKELQPALLLGFDRVGGEFAQFQQPDTAMIQKDASVLVAQPEYVGIVRIIRQQGLTQQSDRIGGAQLAVALALLDQRAVEIGPTVEDARRQITMIEDLDLDLIQLPGWTGAAPRRGWR